MYSNIKNYLDKCIKQNFLSHAYIFYGPDENSKKEIALEFANKILNNGHQKFHPDLFLIKPETGEEITIDLIRQLKKFLSLRPYSAKRKVVIIESGENLNVPAQNALLKIFEEAPAHAVIVLCLKNLDSALPTIVSRGTKLPFWRNQKKSCIIDEKTEEIFKVLIDDKFVNKYSLIEKFSNSEPIEILESWINFLRNRLLVNPNAELNELLQKSQNIYFKLKETNINSKLAFDELFLILN